MRPIVGTVGRSWRSLSLSRSSCPRLPSISPLVLTSLSSVSFRLSSCGFSSSSSASSEGSSPPHLDTQHHLDTFHKRPVKHAHRAEHQEAVNNLLYNVPAQHSQRMHKRTLCALVTNEPGVLSRVSGVLASRNVNIDSLVVSATETPDLSRMTIVLKGGSDVDQARKQLEDLVQVWAVVEFAPHAPIVERELLLVKIALTPPQTGSAGATGSTATASQMAFSRFSSKSDRADTTDNDPYPTSPTAALSTHIQRQAIVELCNLFSGRVLDLTPSFILLEVTGKSIKIDAFIELVRPFGIKELARSGVLAMLRGSFVKVGDKGELGQEEEEEDSGAVDETQLPPG